MPWASDVREEIAELFSNRSVFSFGDSIDGMHLVDRRKKSSSPARNARKRAARAARGLKRVRHDPALRVHAKELRARGLTYAAIGREMGLLPALVRTWIIRY